MTRKFVGVPLDADTHIISQQEGMLGSSPVLYQKWTWEGIVAESFIFANADIAGISEVTLQEIVQDSPMNKQNSGITIKKIDDGFTFVNFNFEVLE